MLDLLAKDREDFPDGPSLPFKSRSDQPAIRPNRYNGYREPESTRARQAGALVSTVRCRFHGKTWVRFSSQETRD
jgi:hypothetical protein